MSRPREAVVTGKKVTKQITNEFLAADRLLGEGLDELSLIFKMSAPTFYQDYWNARVVVDTAASRNTAEEAAKKAAADAQKKAA